MPFNAPLRNASKPCFCGHALTEHTANSVQPNAVSSLIRASYVPGGSLAGTQYYYGVTWVNPNGETQGGATGNITIPSNTLLVLSYPLSGVTGVTGMRFYCSATYPATLQTTVPIVTPLLPQPNMLVSWTMPVTGPVTGGGQAPGANTATTLGCLECGDGHAFSTTPAKDFVLPGVLNSGR